MKIMKTAFLLFLLLPVYVTSTAQVRQKLAPQEFESKMKELKNITLVDVRTPAEFAQGHLANALLLDIYSPDFKTQLAKLDKSKPVFVYCAAGGRSNSAAQTLAGMGFTVVYDLQGGINAWKKTNKPIVK
jgi:rhodanese-related sulfurtransferase